MLIILDSWTPNIIVTRMLSAIKGTFAPFLDLIKSFGTVDREILISKFKKFE